MLFEWYIPSHSQKSILDSKFAYTAAKRRSCFQALDFITSLHTYFLYHQKKVLKFSTSPPSYLACSCPSLPQPVVCLGQQIPHSFHLRHIHRHACSILQQLLQLCHGFAHAYAVTSTCLHPFCCLQGSCQVIKTCNKNVLFSEYITRF